ncbi:NADPH2:quinone reductase [Capronia epimyces CBS 606.96]|uniref:NADPH2:quinone reductase n=1 Tax=Capronia epimyces CBS 606.96 TaxID=1182542 RepID=W9XQG8_9EURO|nr:NADPH2:quinone reductase [Capronia epimyces CBS 606.96]EXJ79570.1 NADPH2:quinone reductase [Capronia epimyces CBS 606.96]
MKGIQVSKYVSGPQDLSVTTLPTPSPHPTKYLVRIYASATNFFDLLQIQGKYQHQPPLPWIAGMEFAGVVIATPTTTEGSKSAVASSIDGTVSGPTKHLYKVGDRVFGAVHGAYATHILAPEDSLFPVPQGWSFADAAGLYVTTPTAYGALVVRAKTQPGEWVLVHAGAGGVGLSAVQIAKALGATVIATAGSERKRQVCLDYGADYVIDYRDKNWPQQVIALCEKHRTGNGKQGVDVVYDPVGVIDPSIKCIAWNGRLLVIGFAGGAIEKVALNRVLLKNISIVGIHWGMYNTKEKETVTVVWKGIFDLISSGKLRGVTYTDKHYKGLESVPAALIALGARDTWGKVIVELGEHEGEEAQSKL